MMDREETWEAVGGDPPGPRSPVPWEDPDLSGAAALYRTLRDLLWHPREFFENRPGNGWGEPLAFALIMGTFGVLTALFWLLLVLAPAQPQPGEAAGLAAALGPNPGTLLGLMAAAPLLVLADLLGGGLCWWGGVALVGAGRGFGPAWRIFCYAQGIMVLGVIPFFGLPIAAVWTLVLMYIGATRGLGLSPGRAQGALAIFLGLQVVLALIILFGLLAASTLLGFLLLLR